jgi:hypothetical protein
MKRLLITASLVLATVSGFSQGTLDFKNIAIVGGIRVVDAPVRDAGGTLLLGTAFRAALYAGAGGATEGELRLIGASQTFQTVTTGAGYFIGGTRTLNENGVQVGPGASATIQVRAWAVASGATWEAATTRGASPLLTIATGGTGTPPGPPSLLTGLQGFNVVVVPEPSTIALGILGGLGTLLMIRRRK